MPVKEMAVSTATFGFMRALAGAVGISVGDAVYTSELRKRLFRIDGIETFIAGRNIQSVANNIKGLTHIEVCYIFISLIGACTHAHVMSQATRFPQADFTCVYKEREYDVDCMHTANRCRFPLM